MALRIRPREAIAQPQGYAEIDWSNPLTEGLVFAALPAGGNFLDVISGQLSLTAEVQRARATIDGGKQSAVSLVGGIITTFPNQTGLDTIAGPHSIFVEGSLETNAATLTVVTTYEPGSGFGFNVQYDDVSSINNGMRYGQNNSSGQVNTGSNALGSNSEQFTHRAMITVDGANGRWYTKGALNSTTAYASFPTANANRRTRVLGNNFGGAAASAALILGFNRALSLSEYRQLYDNPWQIFCDDVALNVATGASGTTISAGPGDASAVGVTASILAPVSIAAGPGAASATGVTALVSRTIQAGPGAASATGVSSLVSVTLKVGPGNASATGVSASVSTSSSTTIAAGPGNASAAGVTALVSISIKCGPAAASATGVAASVGIGQVIAAAVAAASATGVPVLINRTIKAGPGSATATGVTAVLIGYTPPTQLKPIRKTQYVPTGNVPGDLDGIRRYLQLEFERIGGALESAFTHDSFEMLNVEPGKMITGKAWVVYADGTNWDPGSGEGLYVKYGGTWRKLG